MATIVFADTTGHYDGRDMGKKPLGGTESSMVYLARALAARGHKVTVISNCDGVVFDHDVKWQPFSEAPPSSCDLYVPLQHPKLFGLVRKPKRLAVWLVWRGNNLKHYKQLPRMWWYRPIPILMSMIQVHQYSPVLPKRAPQIVIPHGLPDDIRGLPPLEHPPGPELVYASNPARNLHGIVRMWADYIFPKRPDATLRIFWTLKQVSDPWTEWGEGILPRDISPAVRASIKIETAPLKREELMAAVRRSRALIYLGHKTEVFCLTLAEAQALGVPCVVAPIAVLPERVIDGVTGFVRPQGPDFAAAALDLLNDDNLWRSQHEAALRLQQGISWAEMAARFETALLSDFIPTNRSWSAPTS